MIAFNAWSTTPLLPARSRNIQAVRPHCRRSAKSAMLDGARTLMSVRHEGQTPVAQQGASHLGSSTSLTINSTFADRPSVIRSWCSNPGRSVTEPLAASRRCRAEQDPGRRHHGRRRIRDRLMCFLPMSRWSDPSEAEPLRAGGPKRTSTAPLRASGIDVGVRLAAADRALRPRRWMSRRQRLSGGQR